jgi:hypothetical protein
MTQELGAKRCRQAAARPSTAFNARALTPNNPRS